MQEQDDINANIFYNAYKPHPPRINNKIQSKEKLEKLLEHYDDNTVAETPLYQKSIMELFIGLKNTWFDILDDILAGDFSTNMITKNDRLFYIGLTIVIVALLLYIYNYFTEKEKIKLPDKEIKIIERHYIHKDPITAPLNSDAV
jgi:hypothetical protein